jgi:hypothetical protein
VRVGCPARREGVGRLRVRPDGTGGGVPRPRDPAVRQPVQRLGPCREHALDPRREVRVLRPWL